MKHFKEYSERELTKLSRTDVQTLIEIECANQGVKILTRPKNPPKLESIQDDEYFQIEGTSFKSKDEALLRSILRTIQENSYGLQDDDWNVYVGYQFRYLKNEVSEVDYLIKRVKCFKQSTVESNSLEIQKYLDEKKDFEIAEAEFEKENKKVEVIRDRIVEAWTLAKSRLIRANELRVHFEVYKRLASGDESIAQRFFDNAFPGESGLLQLETTGEEAYGRDHNELPF